MQSSIIYKVAVKTTNKEIHYIGQAGNTFKERYNNHQSSMRLRKLENSTALSKCIWNLVDNGTEFKLSWSRIAAAPTYKPSTGRCNLCNLEKTLILFSREELLNSRNEILNKCRHRNKFLLAVVTWTRTNGTAKENSPFFKISSILISKFHKPMLENPHLFYYQSIAPEECLFTRNNLLCKNKF